MAGSDKLVTLGHISGLFGVQGWVKVFSDTRPRQGILDYKVWLLERKDGWEQRNLLQGRRHGEGLIARLAGVDDRDQAAELVGARIAVPREQLPGGLAEGEFYWADLEGLQVVNEQGVDLGRIDHLFETGANDVMVVKGDRERWIPYIWGQVVRAVDLAAGRMTVDWEADF